MTKYKKRPGRIKVGHRTYTRVYSSDVKGHVYGEQKLRKKYGYSTRIKKTGKTWSLYARKYNR